MLTITEVKEGFYPGSMLLLRVLIVIMVYLMSFSFYFIYVHVIILPSCYFPPQVIFLVFGGPILSAPYFQGGVGSHMKCCGSRRLSMQQKTLLVLAKARVHSLEGGWVNLAPCQKSTVCCEKSLTRTKQCQMGCTRNTCFGDFTF